MTAPSRIMILPSPQASFPLPAADAPCLSLDPEGLLLTLLAVGMDFLEACDRIAEADPVGANRAMNAQLKEGFHHRLDLAGRTWITSLPEGFIMGGCSSRLNLAGCHGLTRLPDGLRVDGELNLMGCANLLALPAEAGVGRLEAANCPKLATIGPGFSVRADADLRACPSLVSLPAGLRIGGSLNLNGAASLVSLPRDLRVHRGLALRGCPAWDGLIPEDTWMEPGATIDTDAFMNLRLWEWRSRFPRGERAI